MARLGVKGALPAQIFRGNPAYRAPLTHVVRGNPAN